MADVAETIEESGRRIGSHAWVASIGASSVFV